MKQRRFVDDLRLLEASSGPVLSLRMGRAGALPPGRDASRAAGCLRRMRGRSSEASRTLRAGFVGLLVLLTGLAHHRAELAADPDVPTQSASRGPTLAIDIGHSHLVTHGAFSPTASLVATSSWDGTVRLWDTASGHEVRSLVTGFEVVDQVEFSRDGGLVLAAVHSYDDAIPDAILIWEAQSGTPMPGLQGVGRGGFAMLPGGDAMLVASGEGGLSRTSLASRRLTQEVKGHAKGIARVRCTPDGAKAMTDGWDGRVCVWDVAAHAVIGRAQVGDGDASAALSPDGEWLLTREEGALMRSIFSRQESHDALLWRVSSGTIERRLPGHRENVTATAFAPDGMRLATGDHAGVLRLWKRGGREKEHERHVHRGGLNSIAFSPDSTRLLTCSDDGTAILWDSASGLPLRVLEGQLSAISSMAVASGGRWIVAGSSDGTARVWDLEGGGEQERLGPQKKRITCVAISGDGQKVLSGDAAASGVLWDRAERTAHRFAPPPESGLGLDAVALDSRGTLAILAGYGCGLRLVRLESNGEEWLIPSGRASHLDGPGCLALVDDGERLLSGTSGHAVVLWDLRTRSARRFAPFDYGVESVAASEDGRTVLAAQHWGGTVRLWDTAAGAELMQLHGHPDVISSVSMAPDNSQVLTCGHDRLARLWDPITGRQAQVLSGHSQALTSGAFLRDGVHIVTASDDGTMRIWSRASGRHVCTLASMNDGSWAVIAPDGRFDAPDLEKVAGLSWLLPDDPLRPLPIEIFMRDYYEPRLLPRLLDGRPWPSIPDLASLNRVQPSVSKPIIEPMAGQAGVVRVKVSIESMHDATRPAGKDWSGVWDLRLFRDGRLVGYWDGPVAGDPAKGSTAEVVFENVRVPGREGVSQVEFSAYAFNADRVKGPTAAVTYSIPTDLPRRRGTAYVVAYGVDQFEGAQFKDLSCAARDAQSFTEVVGRQLEDGGAYERVVTVTLSSALERDAKGASTGLLDDHAKKQHLETALRVLAGRPVEPALLERIRTRIKGGELATSMPEDLVLVMASTHGFTDPKGEFYLVPSDVREASTLGWEASCISSAELTEWMRDVDAAEMAMVVDACQSAGAVEQEGFKAGPLGSRGLGQLAYDKRMRLLAACQKAGVALEDGGLGHGFLTYALLHDGLAEDLPADTSPRDGAVTLGEWMAYARDRVPVLDEKYQRGELRQWVLPEAARPGVQPSAGKRPLNTQTPSLFDFARGQDPVVLARTR